MKHFVSFWKKIFKYHGTATLGEYWVGVLTLLIPNVLSFVIAFKAITIDDNDTLYRIFSGVSVAFFVIAIITLIPFISLTVRRLHAVSKSGWWAGLLLFLGIGMIILMLMCSGLLSTFVSFVPKININGCVYGPPENYNPSENMVEDVYGPPEPYVFSEEDEQYEE